MPTDPKEHFKYGLMVVDAAKAISAKQNASIKFVDQEVIPPFDGSPVGIFIWFICETSEAASAFKQSVLTENICNLKLLLIDSGFPSDAVDTLEFDVTSVEEIDEGGGRFAYFR